MPEVFKKKKIRPENKTLVVIIELGRQRFSCRVNGMIVTSLIVTLLNTLSQ